MTWRFLTGQLVAVDFLFSVDNADAPAINGLAWQVVRRPPPAVPQPPRTRSWWTRLSTVLCRGLAIGDTVSAVVRDMRASLTPR